MAHALPAGGKPNRLAAEPSPYLLQHAHNPVDWWPWSDAAFTEAKRRDVPVFLSIGYATCHWCHVMAHESFEDPDVARLLNDAFVCVKVDREERPDLDDLYMAVCQMMTGSGGWPLTVVLTPERKPFFAGTYFPRTSRFGRMGMLDLVPRLKQGWATQRKELESQAEHILQHVRGEEHGHDDHGHDGHGAAKTTTPPELGAATIDLGVGGLAKRFDAEHGGFGGRPKFPSPHNLLFLLRAATRPGKGDSDSMRMVEWTLDAMAAGGIRDHLGGGFHRYSTDTQWLLPHFEKMLYDQAMLAMAYTEAFQATGHERHAAVARSILDYVLRDLTDQAGGFHSAEDADSEGVEGKFYVWTKQQVIDAVGQPDGALVCAAYAVAAEGNFHDESTHQLTGANILHLPRPLAEVAQAKGLAPAVLDQRLAAARSKLLAVRARRVRPLKDDKVLTDWNGLVMAAFAKAGTALGEPRYTTAAQRCATFLRDRMRMPDGSLRHRYRAGVVDSVAFLDDHAFLVWGLLELYDATLAPEWLAWARDVAGRLHTRFGDPAGGHWNAAASPDLLARRKEAYDGALPSGNALAAWCFIRLARLTGESVWEERAQATLTAFAPAITQAPFAYTMSLVALDLGVTGGREVLVTDGPGQEALLAQARAGFRPRDVLLAVRPGLEHAAPWTADYRPVAGKAAAYVCEDHACKRPVTDGAALRASLA